MAIVEAISIPVNLPGQENVAKAATDFTNLSEAVKQTEQEAKKLAGTYGLNDERTQTAIKTAGNYKKQMNDLQKAIGDNANGVGNLTKATQGVVAGMQIAVGVAGLFGTENKELEKSLLQVQSAMSLSQGIKDFKEFLPVITSMAGAIKTQLVAAFTTLRGAIMATGIGALVIAIAVAIEQISNYNDSIEESIDKEQLLAKTRETEGIESINAQNRAYESATEIRLLLAQKEGKSQQEIADLEISLAKERRDALRSIYADDNKTQAERAKALEDYLKISDKVTKLELNRDIAANEIKKGLDAQAAADAEKAAAEAQKLADEQFEMEIAQIVENDRRRQELADEEFNNFYAQEAENERRRQELADEEFENFYAQEVENERRRTELKDKEAAQDKARKEAVAALEQEIFDNSQALAAAIISIAGQNSKAGKAIALASIAADTAVALSGALANSQAPTPDNVATGGLAGIAKYIALATTILTNSKRAYDIIKAPAPSTQLSGGGGGAAAAAAAVPRFNAPSTRIPGGGDEFTQVRRIYVTERDITNVQDKVRVTEGLSQF
jgi:hypothetical protein